MMPHNNYLTLPYLTLHYHDTMLSGPAYRPEVRHNVGHQISAHFDCGVKVIFKQASRQHHCF